ncbi:MAG: glycosyltransferase family 4 protein [Saprospiraceae bacterium]|nr:glycosyltransferase family 4 protein [Saprospiraceae bacterium]
MKKILFMGLHRPDRSPSQRYRFEQFQPYLEQHGFIIDYFYIIREQDDIKFYSSGNYFTKMIILFRSIFKLVIKSFSAHKFDLIFVQREAFMLGTVFFERLFSRKTRMIYDFDDSIWLQVVSEGNKSLSFLKDANKTSKLIGMADVVFAGNSFLNNYALKYNSNSKLVPTVVDTDNYSPKTIASIDRVCIGWSGSFSTIPYFEQVLTALKKIKEKYGDKIYFKVISDKYYFNEELDIYSVIWSSAIEVEELSEIDIGIMPLPDDEWTKGKCALKALLYMSMGQAAVLSPVGVNEGLIEDGVNGFLARTNEEWVDKLSLLIDNTSLRATMGDKARKMVVDQYSVLAHKDVFVRYISDEILK